MGHESVETTSIYAHVSIEKLKQVYQATHPANLPPEGKPNGTLPDLPSGGGGEPASPLDITASELHD
jgi:hypothetical protein